MKIEWVYLPRGRRITREAYDTAIAELKRIWGIG